jgi:hypothetical protein
MQESVLRLAALKGEAADRPGYERPIIVSLVGVIIALLVSSQLHGGVSADSPAGLAVLVAAFLFVGGLQWASEVHEKRKRADAARAEYERLSEALVQLAKEHHADTSD